MNNPFKVGDLVKLRPDADKRATGGDRIAQSWRDTLKQLVDKQGKITRVSTDSKFVTVEYPQSWTSKDEYGRSYTVNSIGINFTELVPTSKPELEEGVLGSINPAGLGVAARQLVAAFNGGQIDKPTLTKKMEELMWQSRTKDPNAWGWLKSTVDRLKTPSNSGIKLKFEEGVGYVYDKDMKKDPKHIKGKRWTVKYESEEDLADHGHTMKTPVNESEIREIIQELLQESPDDRGLSYALKAMYDKIIQAKIIFKNAKDPVKKAQWQRVGQEVSKRMIEALAKYKEITGRDWSPSNRPKPEWFSDIPPLSTSQAPKYDPGLEEGDFYHPMGDDEVPVIPGSEKLSMMKPKAKELPKRTPVPVSNETPEQLRARLLSQLKKKVTETVETRDKNYIIWARSGPGGASYYCESPTQGGRMVQFARDMAKRFQTLEKVYHKINELKPKYKGMTNWNYEIVQNPFTSATPFTQPISPQRPGHTVSKPVKRDGEWIVRYMINGKTDDGKTYYTDDREDAFATYAYMVKTAEAENQKS